MNIYKNFLPNEDINFINKIMTSDSFPWYFRPTQVKNSLKDTPFLSHTFFYNGNKNSEFFFFIEPILKKLKIKNILNIRANLSLRGLFYCAWHVDDFTKNLKHNTAIFYLNTNNGYTEFKDSKIKCQKNKIIVFEANKEHRAVGQTDKPTRMVINFNYESY